MHGDWAIDMILDQCPHRGKNILHQIEECYCYHPFNPRRRHRVKFTDCQSCTLKKSLPSVIRILPNDGEANEDCVHYSNEIVRHVKCGSCAGQQTAIHGCGIFGECVLLEPAADRIRAKTGEIIHSCEGCNQFTPRQSRRAGTSKLNKKAPNMAVIKSRLKDGRTAPVVEAIKTRNLMMHIWPVKGFGAWQWNCDQLLKRASLFNGKRIVSIVTSKEADPQEAVKEYLKDFTDDFIVMPNDPGLREVITWLPMLEKLQSLDPTEMTFTCHAKGVRHNIRPDNVGSTVYHWAKIMYESCLDYWPLAESQLLRNAMTGSFRRFGEFTTPGNNRWHYSGTFYWFRHKDVFENRWRKVDQKFFGTESWPGHLFQPSETGCLFHDMTSDLYDARYMHHTVLPAWEAWKQDNVNAVHSQR